jgi:hypothetical protein
VREHKWTFLIIDEMFQDDTDYKGLLFWYDDVKIVSKELSAKQ